MGISLERHFVLNWTSHGRNSLHPLDRWDPWDELSNTSLIGPTQIYRRRKQSYPKLIRILHSQDIPLESLQCQFIFRSKNGLVGYPHYILLSNFLDIAFHFKFSPTFTSKGCQIYSPFKLELFVSNRTSNRYYPKSHALGLGTSSLKIGVVKYAVCCKKERLYSPKLFIFGERVSKSPFCLFCSHLQE